MDNQEIPEKLTFFSGIHSQSSYLQQKRSADSFTGTVSITDVFNGEDMSSGKSMETIPNDVLDHIEDVISKHTKEVLMEEGDIVLLDSYQTLHGRKPFKGIREHGVIWLTK